MVICCIFHDLVTVCMYYYQSEMASLTDYQVLFQLAASGFS